MKQGQRAALVLEPMPLIAAAAADNLIRLGFARVELAPSIDAALDLIGRFQFDYALLTVVHREGSIALVAALLDQAGVPYLLVSDLADGRDRPPELLDTGYVTKPYCLSDIARALGQEAAPCAMR
jgi:DNA-binding response OmpR family regulator